MPTTALTSSIRKSVLSAVPLLALGLFSVVANVLTKRGSCIYEL